MTADKAGGSKGGRGQRKTERRAKTKTQTLSGLKKKSGKKDAAERDKVQEEAIRPSDAAERQHRFLTKAGSA